jgi:thymidine kinase
MKKVLAIKGPRMSGKTHLALNVALEQSACGNKVLYIMPSIDMINRIKTRLSNKNNITFMSANCGMRAGNDSKLFLNLCEQTEKPDYIILDEANNLLNECTGEKLATYISSLYNVSVLYTETINP